MPSKKTYIVIMIIMFVFCLVLFILLGVPNIRQENLEATLIVGDNTTWIYKDKKWGFLRYNTSMEKLNWSTFHVFEDNQDKGEYLLWHDDKWYVFDEKKQAVSMSGKMVAYDANYQMKVHDFQETSVDDRTFVEQMLLENGISTSSKFTSLYKILLDFDGDSMEEEFYIMSNAFPLDFDPEVTFSIAFMVKDGEIYTLYNDVSSNQGLNGCKPFYHTFIDTNYDEVYEVILSCGKYSATDQVDMLYQFIDGEFKLLISNQ